MPIQRDEATQMQGNAKRYDCGRFGQLTAAEIARIAGTSPAAIYARIRKGATGAGLCEQRWARQSQIRKKSPPRRDMLVCAFRIAHEYPDRLPTIAEIRRIRPMSVNNAGVWRQAIHAARLCIGLGK